MKRNLVASGDSRAPGDWQRWLRAARARVPLLAAILVTLSLWWHEPLVLTRLDLLAYDVMAPMRDTTADTAVVIAIDDQSLAALGRWPWPRATHARMVDALRVAGVPAVALTIMFAEPDRHDPQDDALLAAAILRHGKVVLPVAPMQRADGVVAESLPDQELRASRAGLGHVDAEIDIDGLVRRVYLDAGVGAARYPALAVAMRDLLDGALTSLPGMRRDPGVPAAALTGAWVRDHEVLLPQARRPTQLSYALILDSPDLAARLRGRPVFLGVTANGLGGELATPLSGSRETVPAVEFHARVFEALRDGSLVSSARSGQRLAFALLLVCSVALWPRPQRRPHALWVLGSVAIAMIASAVILHAWQVWLAPLAATSALLVAAAVWLTQQVRGSRRDLARAQQHSLATLRAIGDGVVTVDRQLQVSYANPVALRLVGGQPLMGQGLRDAFALQADGLERLHIAIQECLRQGRVVRLSPYLMLPSESDAPRSLRVSVSPLRSDDVSQHGAVIVLSDVSDAVASANRLEHAATHDALTGLPNRILLTERLGLALARIERHGGAVAVLFLDLDRFKRINDSLGHSLGDEVLRITARRLLTICRSTDFVVRWGGDEFVVVMENVSAPDSVAVAAAKLVSQLSEDVEVNGMRLASSCSIGIVMAPQDGVEIDALLAKADTAMYRAKSHPDTGFHFYSDELRLWTRERLTLEVDLRHALRDDLFELHYQPQYRLGDQALVGFEALIRWRRTPEQLVQPSDFIGVAEETGLIVEIGAWVIKRVTQDLARWLAEGRQPSPVAVNVSARQCVNRDIVEVVRAALMASGVPPALLKLEITETTAMTDAARVIELLEEISALGVHISVDDFGTGYSSLAYLKRLPINELKIDRAFVQDVATDPDDAAIVRATIALAHELGLLVVAEGVENEQQSAFLAAQNCDIVQGFLYGRPQPLDQSTLLS